MPPKRKERIAPPPINDEWEVKCGETEAGKGWAELEKQAPGNTRKAWDDLRTNPRAATDSRHHRLRANLASRLFEGRVLEQWQIEVTGAGRIWYLIDDVKHTVWVVRASCGHPKATE